MPLVCGMYIIPLNNDEQRKAVKARTLESMWPQYVNVAWRFGRPHHQISWKKHFKHPLIKKKAA